MQVEVGVVSTNQDVMSSHSDTLVILLLLLPGNKGHV